MHERSLHDFYTTVKSRLDDFWITFERLAHNCWTTFKSMLDDFWITLGQHLHTFWMTFKSIVDDLWTTFKQLNYCFRQKYYNMNSQNKYFCNVTPRTRDQGPMAKDLFHRFPSPYCTRATGYMKCAFSQENMQTQHCTTLHTHSHTRQGVIIRCLRLLFTSATARLIEILSSLTSTAMEAF